MQVKLESHYDCLILGMHPSALMSASFIAKMGLSVLLVPYGSYQETSISESNLVLDPEPNYILGLGKFQKFNGLIYKCLSQLEERLQEFSCTSSHGKKRDFKQFLKFSHSQVLTPNSRFTYDSYDIENAFSQNALFFELTREFGKHWNEDFFHSFKLLESSCLRFWESFPEIFHKKIGIKKILDKKEYFENEFKKNDFTFLARIKFFKDSFSLSSKKMDQNFYLKKWENEIVGLWIALSSVVPVEPHCIEAIRILSLARTAASFQGGMSHYRSYLLDLALSYGVHFLKKSECHRIFINKNRFSGIQIAHHASPISFDGMILGGCLKTALKNFFYSNSSFFSTLKTPLTPLGWRFTIALKVRIEGIPEKLASRAIWQDQQTPYLEIERAHGEQTESETFQVLYLRTIMPFHKVSLDRSYQKSTAHKMLKSAYSLFPFLEHHVLEMYPEINAENHASFDASLKILYPYNGLSDISENLLIFSGKGLGSQSGIERMFLVSDESYPSLGHFGSMLAAIESVAWFSEQFQLKKPFFEV